MTTNINCCARCGNDHKDVELREFTNPPFNAQDEPITHFGNCPALDQPILVSVTYPEQPEHNCD